MAESRMAITLQPRRDTRHCFGRGHDINDFGGGQSFLSYLLNRATRRRSQRGAYAGSLVRVRVTPVKMPMPSRTRHTMAMY